MNERYRFIRRLGSGGMAEVYLAMARGAEGFEKPVAIKRVLPRLASDEQIAQMFVGEARLSMHLHHQNIVQMLDVARNPQGLFLVMELVNGWDLDVVLRSAPEPARPLPEPLAAFVVGQVVSGLSHAYRQEVDGRPLLQAHRDVSPSNILVTVDGEVKIGDFGIARIESASRLTEPGGFKGKVAYASPEAIRGEAVTRASDQFSLGTVLYEMLLGQLPFGRPDNVVRYAEALARGPQPSFAGISPELAALLSKMLSLRPEERFASIEAVGEQVAGFLSRCGQPASARELARFLSSVSLPVPPLELLRQAEKTTRPIPLTQVSGAPPSDAVAAISPALANTQPARPAFSFGDSPLEELNDWAPTGPALDESGQLYGKVAPDPAPTAPAVPVPTWASDFTLESLRNTPPAAQSAAPAAWEEVRAPRRRRGALRAALLFLFVLIAGGAGLMFWLQTTSPDVYESYSVSARDYLAQLANKARDIRESALGPRQPALLRIESEPPGALVEVDGTVIGSTPMVQENIYPEGRVSIRLRLAQYKPWRGTFEGGKEAHVEAKLEPVKTPTR